MKRFVFGGLVICLLTLSGGFFMTVRAVVHAAQPSGGQTTVTSSFPISSQRLKDLVHQTLGQQAADSIGHRVTQPLAIHASAHPILPLIQTRATTSSRLHAKTQERYGTSPIDAAYLTDAEGVSWVQGAGGFFNVASVPLPAVSVLTAIAVGNSDSSAQINVGVDQTEKLAVLTFNHGREWDLFSVNANDQMDAEIYLDGNTNQWLIFIEDLTTRTSFGQEFAYTNYLTRAAWTTQVAFGGPVPSMNMISFTNARWVSNWDGWQPITSSAAAYYVQLTLRTQYGGRISPTQPDSSGTSFTLIPCPSCS
ncbi:MAG: hypothetical protein JO011_11340 [Ktedonobacteraceae bacterium]|nr:hypothetical protein [Ktedonobacteraceae bacterium]